MRLRQFTVADLVADTGLNTSSISTELQRMMQAGLLTSKRLLPVTGKRGGAPVLYQLNPDPQVRLELWKSVRDFYGPSPIPSQPTSAYYESARNLINKAQFVKEKQLDQLLTAASVDLEAAYHAEGASLAHERVKHLLQYEHARIFFWRGEYIQAEELFEQLLKFFTQQADDLIVKIIQEYLFCIENQGLFKKDDSPKERARLLLETLKKREYKNDSPVAMHSLKIMWDLTQSAEKEIQQDALSTVLNAVADMRQEFSERFDNLDQKLEDEIMGGDIPPFSLVATPPKPKNLH
jgi:tetratricopeptide (TPR) repeat protein